jgi:hypothetical protein
MTNYIPIHDPDFNNPTYQDNSPEDYEVDISEDIPDTVTVYDDGIPF